MSDVEEYSLHANNEYCGPEHGSRPSYEESDQQEVNSTQSIMSLLLRETDHETEIHIKEVWSTDFEYKAGIVSKKEYSDIFSEELEWDDHHQKWDTERTSGTDMWEIDLSSVFDVALLFLDRGVDVTIDDEVREAYMRECV